MGRIPVNFCSSNLTEGSQAVWDRLEQKFGDILQLHNVGCLGHCGRCADGPFCLVGPFFFQAKTTDELWQRVEQLLTDVLADD